MNASCQAWSFQWGRQGAHRQVVECIRTAASLHSSHPGLPSGHWMEVGAESQPGGLSGGSFRLVLGLAVPFHHS